MNEVIKANESVLRLSSIEDIKKLNKILFMTKLLEKLNKIILNNHDLKMYFQQNQQKYEDYEIKNEELELLEQNKLKGKQLAGKELKIYIKWLLN